MSTQSEAVLEENLINKLSNEGYERIAIKDEDQLNQNFKTQIEKFNHCELSDEEFRKLLIYLNEGSIYDKAKKLRDRYYVDRDNDSFYISFLNQKDWCRNSFQISNQITMRGKYENRYDVTILINGLPLVQIELKRRGMALKEAFNQINRYKRHSYKGLFNYIQIFVISNGVNTKYFANGDAPAEFGFTYFWKDEDNRNITNLDEFAETFLEKCNLAKMISRYMVFHESDKTLMVLRAYQKYAAEAIVNQALNVKQNGYVWHTTGSGKTLTSFKASQLLAEEEDIDKVIFVVDRRDLDIQTNKEFNSFCPGCVDNSDNTRALVKNLLSDKNKMITTTIQKLSKAVKNPRDQKKLENLREKNIIFIYDECHRSQFGEMHQAIDEFFINSLSYGFTGTPIFEENSQGVKTTKDIFKKRLHSYLIKDAIADENVLGFSVDYYHWGKMKEIPDEDVAAIDEKEVLQSRQRLNLIVDNIIETYDAKTLNREFNALFTVPSGGVIHDYYKLFKQKDHDLKVATIFTYNPNEEIEEGHEHSRDMLESYIQDYNEMFGTDFSTDTFKEYYADVSKRMKNRDIDLLIVVDMFLTGFDSKPLNTLYVDKNMNYHKLLQAFSRTNRITNKRKSQGNIVNYRNIEKDVNNAIRLFSDSDAIEDVILPSYDYFIERFNQDLDKLFSLVKTAEDAINLQSEEQEKEFVLAFRNLTRTKNKLDTFAEFTFNDVNIEEQEFNDFKSAYLDINDTKPKDKTSVLNDIDFELELFKTDEINVDYILNLLKDLDHTQSSYDHDKGRIINLMKQSENLRSKIGLIEKFIDNNLPAIKDTDVSVFEEFNDFMEIERKQAMCDIVSEEKLDEETAREIFDKYEFSEKFDDDLIKKSFTEKLGFKNRKSKVKVVKDKITELFDMFNY